MSIAPRIEAHLSRVGVPYEIVHHSTTSTSMESARAAHIPATQMAKAVTVFDGENYRVCVIPASHRLMLNWLNRHMSRRFRLVPEDELEMLFEDCEAGAVPALGQVYGLPVIWDQSLLTLPSVYFESGDHENLIRLDHGSFMQIMGLQDHAVISCPTDEYEDQAHLVH